jgi:dipeptidyl aminopeptidase/acylaminoacyl peptidase
MMRRLFCGVVLALAVHAAIAAQSRDAVIDQTIATLLKVQSFGEVAISPDARRVAYLRREEGRREGSIFIAKADGSGDVIRISAAPVPGATTTPAPPVPGSAGKVAAKGVEESSIAWSPDGREIAFLSNAPGAQQLFIASSDGRDVRPLTSVKGALSEPKWSPDGKSIALLVIENASRRGGATEAMTPPSGDVEMQVEEQRIAIVDVATRALQFATPANMFVYDFDWAPTSRGLVAEATFGSGENNYWIAQLFRFDLGDINGRAIYKPALQIAWPRWSPDGKNIAFIEGLMSDQGANGGDVMIVPADGGAPANLAAGMRASASSLSWMPDSQSVLVGEVNNGNSAFARVHLTHALELLWSGAERVTSAHAVSLSTSRDTGTTAVIRESFDHPPEVWVGPIGAWKQLTHANAQVKPLWSAAENLNWSNDGFDVQGWLLYPRDLDRSKKYPMVVQVHGGPSGAAMSSWPSLNLAALAANGYIVFLPNPRGSFGQGEAFTKANVKDFGYGDFRDILAGVEAAVAKAPVDPKRVGIWGWSYGGYMTMWAVTQTNRFRAAVSGAGVANWQSYYGQNSIDQWMIPFFGASVYDDPWIYERSSPITFIKNVKTPTLVLVGDRDGEVPAPQSFEFWHALRTEGVKTQLIVYPNEGHGIRNPEHRRDITRRLVGWFDRYMTGE